MNVYSVYSDDIRTKGFKDALLYHYWQSRLAKLQQKSDNMSEESQLRSANILLVITEMMNSNTKFYSKFGYFDPQEQLIEKFHQVFSLFITPTELDCFNYSSKLEETNFLKVLTSFIQKYSLFPKEARYSATILNILSRSHTQYLEGINKTDFLDESKKLICENHILSMRLLYVADQILYNTQIGPTFFDVFSIDFILNALANTPDQHCRCILVDILSSYTYSCLNSYYTFEIMKTLDQISRTSNQYAQNYALILYNIVLDDQFDQAYFNESNLLTFYQSHFCEMIEILGAFLLEYIKRFPNDIENVIDISLKEIIAGKKYTEKIAISQATCYVSNVLVHVKSSILDVYSFCDFIRHMITKFDELDMNSQKQIIILIANYGVFNITGFINEFDLESIMNLIDQSFDMNNDTATKYDKEFVYPVLNFYGTLSEFILKKYPASSDEYQKFLSFDSVNYCYDLCIKNTDVKDEFRQFYLSNIEIPQEEAIKEPED